MRNPPRLTDPPNRIVTALLSYAVLAGVLFLAGVYTPRSIDETMPPPVRTAWAVMLAGGALVALAGQYWRGRIFTGARLKRGGLIFAAGGMLAAGSAVLAVNGVGPGGFSAGTNLVFGLSFLDRSHQIQGLLRAAVPHAEAIHRGGEEGRGAVC